MHRLTLIIAITLLTAFQLDAQNMKVGVVNSEAVMQAYPEFRRAEEQLGREVEAWRADRTGWEKGMEAMQAEIIELDKQLQSGSSMLSENAKMERAMQLEAKQVEYQEKLNQQMALEQEKFNQRRAELLAEVLETVNGVIEQIGEDQDYDLIFDAANGTVVYARDPIDMTDELLQKLQE